MAPTSETVTISAFHPMSSGVLTVRSTWTPSTTRSVASTTRPGPGRVTAAASSPMPRSPSSIPPPKAANRTRRASMSRNSSLPGVIWAPRSLRRDPPPNWVCTPDLPSIVPGSIPLLLASHADSPHADQIPRGRRPALPAPGGQRHLHQTVRGQAPEQLLGSLRSGRRGPRRGPNLYLLSRRGRRRTHQQLAGPGRDARRADRPVPRLHEGTDHVRGPLLHGPPRFVHRPHRRTDHRLGLRGRVLSLIH